MEFLSAQKEEFSQFLETLTEEQLKHSYAEGKWTLREVLVHIFDTEQIFCYRLLCTARGEKQALPGFDQDHYISNAELDDYSLEFLINYFTITRYNTLILLKGIAPDIWNRTASVSGYNMSMTAFPYFFGGHLQYHWNIIRERYL